MLKSPLLLLAVCVATLSVSGQGPTLDNQRPRLPVGQGAAVACITPDLNGDGLADLVRASNFDFGIWVQGGAGKFHAVDFPKQIPTTIPRQEIVALATGRITAKNSRDVVVAYRSGLVQIYPNVRGTFGKPIRLPSIAGALNPAIEQILVGDLDAGANALDEIVLLLDLDRPVVYWPTGTGLFKQAMLMGGRVHAPRGLLVDLDLDADLDLLVVTGGATPALPNLYLNTGGAYTINTAAFGRVLVAAGKLVAADVLGNKAPELFLSPVGSSAARVMLFRNNTTTAGAPAFLRLSNTNNFYTVLRPRDFDVVDLNGDGYRDLVAVTIGGAVTYGLSAGASGPVSYAKAKTLLALGLRSKLCATDLDGDGDTDLLVAGAGIEDSLLLGGPAGMPVSDLDTEAQGMPVRQTPPYLLEAIDLTGDGDLDLALWPIGVASAPVLLRNVDGQARFVPLSYSGQVPSLPRSDFHAMHGAAVTGPGHHDILVLGQISVANPTGMQVWVRGTKPALSDQTTARWRIRRNFTSIVAADLSGAVIGSAGKAGYADIVGIDSLGIPWLVFNRSGVYDKQVALSSTAAALDSQLAVVDLNLDGRADILISQPGFSTRILMAGAIADTFRELTALPIGGPALLAQDLTGDLIPDLLVSVSGTAKKLVFLQGLGNGQFVNRSSVYLAKVGALPATVIELALLEGESAGQYSVVVGFARAPDQLLRATNRIFAGPGRLPLRGSHNTSRFLVRDFDLDGDQDLVISRRDTMPALLLGQATDFCNLGVGQAGRQALIHIAYPDLATTGGLAIGFPTTRIDLGGVGILRLANISVVLAVPSTGKLAQTLRLPLPPTLGPLQIPMQLFTLRGGGLQFRNLDKFRPTMR